MRFRYTLFLGMPFLFLGTISYGITDLEIARSSIVAILDEEQPTCVTEFHSFFKKYDDLVFNFFDKKNNDSLKTHIEHMETELQVLKNVCNDDSYSCIHPILCDYRTHLTDLIVLLKQYIGSYDTLTLSLKLRKFKPVLPKVIKKRSEISLFWAINHRLWCRQ